METNVAIIICTFNRAEIVRRTLDSFGRLKVPAGVAAELVIVDNNSTDHTREVCTAVRTSVPIRYIFEPKQGKCNALNRALTDTNAPLMLFTDDDVDVEENWLAEFWDATLRVPDATYFGGRILTRWEEDPPPWCAQHATTHLAGLCTYFDLGNVEKVWSQSVAGANMAVRRAGLQGVLFDPSLGPQGGSAVRCEENEFLAQLRKRGATGYYVPTAVLHHRTPGSRMTESYVRYWFKGDGMAEVRRNQIVRKHPIFGVSRHYWRVLVTNAVKYTLTRWIASAAVWLPAEIAMARAWGVIVEARREISGL
jgi:glycosyltransferase involved in cell wall biosynthesis